jgi:hypothetical protein
VGVLAAAVLFGVLVGAADYTRVAAVQPDDDVALSRGAVLVGATPEGGVSELAFHGLDGAVRPVALPEPARFVEELAASDSAVAVIALLHPSGRQVGYFGAVGGPLRPLPQSLIDLAVTGETVVSLHDRRHRGRGWLELRRAGDGRPRRIRLEGRAVAVVTAAGRYAAYASNFASRRETTRVVDLETGRERYRVRTPPSTAYGLARDGRLWFVAGERRTGRILTATPRRPRPRTVARMRVHPYELAVTGREVAVVRNRKRLGAGGEVVLVRPNGARRAVMPTVPSLASLAYDGTTLAFAAGACVFAGPVPAGVPAPLSLAGC